MATYSDTHLVLNALVAQSEGKEDIESVSVDNIASFGDKLVTSSANASKDIVFKTLLDRIGRTITDLLPYENKFAYIFKDAFHYGVILQTLHVDNFEARTSGIYDNLDENDVDEDIYKVNLPTVHQKLFENQQPWEFKVTITDLQIKSAFTDETTLAAFINGIFTAMNNSIVKYLETSARTVYCDLIAHKMAAEEADGVDTLHAVNVLQQYYDETGIELNFASGEWKYNADFLRWLTSTFTDYVGLFEEMSVIFNTDDYETFTPRDQLHFVINNKIADNIKRFMQSDVYNKELVGLPAYKEISSWQALGKRASLDKRLAVKVGYGSGASAKSVDACVIAVMHDDRVLSMTLKDRYTVDIPNKHGHRRNVWEQGTICNFINMGHNALVFYVDTVTTA